MIDYAKRYEDKVLNGDLIACKDIKRACEIDQTSRQKAKSDDYPYYYDQQIADQYVKLAKLISPKQPVDFQLWFISIINGWRLKSDHGRIRRFNSGIFSTARKNAKSTLASIILVSELLKNEIAGKSNKEYYIVASKLSQALLTLRQCKAEVKRLQQSSELCQQNFRINKTTIYSLKTGSLIKALPSRSQNLDGLNSDIVIADETHAYRDSKLLDVLSSSQGQNPNALLLQTTTAGFNYGGSLRKDWTVAEHALKCKETGNRSFDALFTQDNTHEVTDNPATWTKSNPLLTVPKVKQVMKPYLKEQLHNAMVKDRSNAMFTKNFNLWSQENSDGFLDDPKEWTDNDVKPIDLMNRSGVVLGVDLSRTHDLTAVSFTVPIDNDRYYTDTFSFVATKGGIENKSKADKIDYLALEKAGMVKIERHDFGLINYNDVTDYIEKLISKYHWKNVTVAYDPWGSADGLIQNLGVDPNINMVKVSQSIRNLTGTIRWLYRLILEHRLLHKSSILYNYAFNNLKTSYDIHGNLYLNKSRSVNKIDPVFALIDSLYIQKSLTNKPKTSTLSEQIENGDVIF